MREQIKHNWIEWGFVALLGALCAVLTVLQFRWTGEISRAEAERLRGGLDAEAQSFAKTFDDTLTAYCTALVPAEGSVNAANRAAIHLQQFEKWRALNPRPIFRRIAVVVPLSDGNGLLEQSQSDGKLSPLAWPVAWENLRQHFGRDGGGPFSAGQGRLFEFPVFSRSPNEFGGPPESEWIIFELDTNYLQSVWLPELVANHLNLGGAQINQAVIRTTTAPGQMVFSTSAKMDDTVKPVTVRFNRQGRSPDNQRGPTPNFRWRLDVYPQPDALEKLVSASRRKNFAVAVSLNGLILAAGVALVRHTRRSRQLAEQQMNFVANVSHELRTPLTVIRGAAHNLKRGVVTERDQIEKYSGLIIQHAEQLGEMVEQVLQLAGAKKNQSAALRQPVALGEVLHEAIAATAPDVEAAHCKVELEMPPTLPIVIGDAAALRRIFQNLITNAAKHGGAGKWIGITAAHDENAKIPTVEIQVADRGPGIPADELSEIFQPFFRGAMAQAMQIRGSGLGLSLVKETVEAHGGNISVRSENGRGTVFTVRLPTAPKDKIK